MFKLKKFHGTKTSNFLEMYCCYKSAHLMDAVEVGKSEDNFLGFRGLSAKLFSTEHCQHAKDVEFASFIPSKTPWLQH